MLRTIRAKESNMLDVEADIQKLQDRGIHLLVNTDKVEEGIACLKEADKLSKHLNKVVDQQLEDLVIGVEDVSLDPMHYDLAEDVDIKVQEIKKEMNI